MKTSPYVARAAQPESLTLTVTIREREPEVFKEKETGTLLKIGYARSQWTRQLVEKVHRTLRRLQSPIKGPEGKFEITFQCPEYPEYENISPTDILERAHYQIVAPADKQEATRKLEVPQQQERELLKSQATAFGQSLGSLAREAGQTGEVGIPAAAPAVLPN